MTTEQVGVQFTQYVIYDVISRDVLFVWLYGHFARKILCWEKWIHCILT